MRTRWPRSRQAPATTPRECVTGGSCRPDCPPETWRKYLFLAASLRGETIEEAALPPDLRDLATRLASVSQGTRNEARREAVKLEAAKQVAVIRYLASSLRQQGAPDAQKALAESISALAGAPGAAVTAAEELQRLRHAMITAPVPISLFVRSRPQEFRALIEGWRDSPEVPEMARRASAEESRRAVPSWPASEPPPPSNSACWIRADTTAPHRPLNCGNCPVVQDLHDLRGHVGDPADDHRLVGDGAGR